MLQILYKFKKPLILNSNSDILITSQATKAVNENTSGDTAESLHAENSAGSFFIIYNSEKLFGDSKGFVGRTI
ncbi:MAG: hypothetical protein LIO87_07970 [Eubacterium sp.]|nr:hypothetical protein [Eubacterium sp.]